MTARTVDLLAAAKAGPGGAKVPYPIGIREVVVLRTERLASALVLSRIR